MTSICVHLWATARRSLLNVVWLPCAPQFAVAGGALAKEEGGGDDVTVTKLYGEWQTRPWDMPAAEGGCVPKTERGNVNVPPFATRLPAGRRHRLQPMTLMRGRETPWAHPHAWTFHHLSVEYADERAGSASDCGFQPHRAEAMDAPNDAVNPSCGTSRGPQGRCTCRTRAWRRCAGSWEWTLRTPWPASTCAADAAFPLSWASWCARSSRRTSWRPGRQPSGTDTEPCALWERHRHTVVHVRMWLDVPACCNIYVYTMRIIRTLANLWI